MATKWPEMAGSVPARNRAPQIVPFARERAGQEVHAALRHGKIAQVGETEDVGRNCHLPSASPDAKAGCDDGWVDFEEKH